MIPLLTRNNRLILVLATPTSVPMAAVNETRETSLHVSDKTTRVLPTYSSDVIYLLSVLLIFSLLLILAIKNSCIPLILKSLHCKGLSYLLLTIQFNVLLFPTLQVGLCNMSG